MLAAEAELQPRAPRARRLDEGAREQRIASTNSIEVEQFNDFGINFLASFHENIEHSVERSRNRETCLLDLIAAVAICEPG